MILLYIFLNIKFRLYYISKVWWESNPAGLKLKVLVSVSSITTYKNRICKFYWVN